MTDTKDHEHGKVTPAMQQYYAAKEQYPDCIIFFRMGDFYETFCEDAEICARELEITLTSRGKMGDGEAIPLAGVPYHAVESYLGRMIQKGYKVAICEQIEDPKKAKGVVKRDVVRVITPGTVIDANLLSSDHSRFLMALCEHTDEEEGGKKTGRGERKQKSIGLSFLDISTGEFYATSIETPEVLQKKEKDSREFLYHAILGEISAFSPVECIVSNNDTHELHAALSMNGIVITPCDPDLFSYGAAVDLLTKQAADHGTDFHDTLASFGGRGVPGVRAAGAALNYARKTQFHDLGHVHPVMRVPPDHMVLDSIALRNLEIIKSISERTETGTLVETIDLTKTPMGKRLIRRWITVPLAHVAKIEERLDAVSWMYENTAVRLEMQALLSRYPDIERIAGRISYGNVSPRDLVTLKNALVTAQRVQALSLAAIDLSPALHLACHLIQVPEDAVALISHAIVDDPPALARKGGMIREGYHDELDHIHDVLIHGRQWISDLEREERDRTGIKSLKVKYNGVFGYFIEIPRTQASSVPEEYERRQTMANAERYTTKRLRELAAEVATADERHSALEQELYASLVTQLRMYISKIQEISRGIAILDVFISFAEAAHKFRYVRPVLTDDGDLLLRSVRHAVVEQMLGDRSFVPNDCEMQHGGNQICIITGANMAGKSTYMRSVCHAVIMAQAGCFVACDYARIGVVDRICTRVGAFDDLASGQSTFMVEMRELASILHSVSDRSLIILDEIGRGTSTLDGYSIAKAVLEFLHGKRSTGPKTLFATHFHEIIGIESELRRVSNWHFAVKDTGSDVIFLRRLIPGATDRSYGVHVAVLAGVPKKVCDRATEVLQQVLSGNEAVGVKQYTQMVLVDEPRTAHAKEEEAVLSRLKEIDPDTLRPIDALTILSDLCHQVRRG
ncbi:MAG: DNA mismatch repair protein MutS [Methanomicrobiales archaeon]|jgi:DNA mismatch repair protein MutS|nr:DNA mismatch repair protein MutS [Methanomicrobiales archaeon]